MEAQHVDQARQIPRYVYHEGAVAVGQGFGLCYDHDVTETGHAATVRWGRRDKQVILPDSTSNRRFAGVAKRDYVATDNMIEVLEPGSTGLIYVAESVTIGDLVWCRAGGTVGTTKGAFYKTYPGIREGRGAALILQTRTGAGLVQAKLLDGPESELFELLTPVDATAVQSMVGGATYIAGGITLGTGDSTTTLADGLFPGALKYFECVGTLTTNDYHVDFATAGIEQDNTTALADLDFDAADERILLIWSGGRWREVDSAGVEKS